MTKGQRKNFFREIKDSLNRYLSILFIVALGVAFYTGIRSSEPDMKLTTDTYMDQQRFMDVRVLSTLGLTEDDLTAIRAVRGVAEAEGIYSGDFLTLMDGTEKVLSAMTVPEDIGQLYIEEGRLPLKSGECFLDERFAKAHGLTIGDSLTLYSGTDEPIEDALQLDTYTIVGLGKNPYYLTWERGNSAIGTGKVAGFIALPKADFKSEAYTQIYVRGEGAAEMLCYSDEYEKWVDELQERIEAIAAERCGARYDEVVVAGWDEVADAKAQLSDGQKQLDDAKKELDDARAKLEDGQKEYDDGMAELTEKEQELADGKAALEAGRQELDRQEAAFEEARIQVVVMETMLTAAQSAYEEYMELYYELLARLTGQDIQSPEELREWLIENGLDPDAWEGSDLEEVLQEFQDRMNEAKAQVDALVGQVAAARAQLDAASAQLTEAKIQIRASELKLEDGGKQLEDGRRKLEDAKKELEDGWAQLEDGEKEYADAKAEFEEQNADALREIADAEEKLNNIEYPEWYVLDRGTIQTYVEFGQDAESIGKLAQVFPMLFFLVAALVSLTTMTRMVEEERLQIGTMKALGYGKLSIISKYVLYALSASVIGSLLGVLLGGKALPFVIITAYKIMYENLVGLVIPYNVTHSLAAAGMAVGCTVAATMFACYKELLATPAALMRPAAPRQGRRVVLERMGFLWKHLSFSVKSTIRNLLRYKKRFFMTIFGIGACMGLLLVGYGLRDSLMVIVNNQYKTLWVYDLDASVDPEASESDQKALEEYLDGDAKIAAHMRTLAKPMDFEAGGTVRTGMLLVPEEPDRFSEFIVLRKMATGEAIPLEDEGVVLSQKLSQILEVEPGDTFYLKLSETEEYAVRVAGVAEQYSQHFVYVSPTYYEKIFGEAPEYNRTQVNLTGDESREQTSEKLLEFEAVLNINDSLEQHDQIESMLHSLDLVIWVLIFSAGLLAFVVLYNLNNINITERRRELATLKVLGFYDTEVATYVYRENVILTFLGMALGILIGNGLHRYVITTVEIDILLFGRQIQLLSYVYGCLLTLLFAIIVNVSMYYKLKKIDMVESLKSVE